MFTLKHERQLPAQVLLKFLQVQVPAKSCILMVFHTKIKTPDIKIGTQSLKHKWTQRPVIKIVESGSSIKNSIFPLSKKLSFGLNTRTKELSVKRK